MIGWAEIAGFGIGAVLWIAGLIFHSPEMVKVGTGFVVGGAAAHGFNHNAIGGGRGQP